MEIIRILPSESRLWEQVWRLYNESFPDYERRRISSHSRACDDPQFHTKIAVDNGNLQALLFLWENEDFIYIEHIAVNPQMRGKSIGTTILKNFLEATSKTVILEIDPPVDDISRRRQAFYERLGFIYNDYDYRHPSYKKDVQPHELKILSYPHSIDQQQFERFKEYVEEKVLKYID